MGRTPLYGVSCAAALALLAAYVVWGRRGHDPSIEPSCPPGSYLTVNNNCAKRNPAYDALPLSSADIPIFPPPHTTCPPDHQLITGKCEP